MTTLYPYQIEHTNILENAILKYGRAIDTSDTGTGKTYCAISLCKKLKYRPFIVCPKVVISNWINVLNSYDIEMYGIINYESLLGGNYYTDKTLKHKTKIPFLNIKFDEKNNKKYEWSNSCIPEDIIFIYDEAHRCKNHTSINGKLYIDLTQRNVKILCISATIIDKDIYTEILINTFKLDKTEYTVRRGYFTRTEIMEKLHKVLFPEYGHRMKITELRSNGFIKNNHILIKPIEMENKNEIKKQYNLIKLALTNLKKKRERSSGLGSIIRALQSIELLKLPSFIKTAQDYLSQNHSIAVFFNYSSTLLQFSEYFHTNCIIIGGQSEYERQNNIHSFNSDRSRMIVCNIKAGGVGVSLHDTNGVYPRVSLISPTWSAQDLLQVLGRIYRSNCKTDCIQRILFCSDTYEEIVSNAIQTKIENIGLLNDGDIRSYLFAQEFENIDFTEDTLNQIEINVVDEPNDNDEIQFKELNNSEELNELLLRKKVLENDLKELRKRIKELQ